MLNAKPGDPFNPDCPSRELMELLGSRWTLLIFCALADGPRRSGELERMLKGVSRRVLTERLRQLEQFRLVQRTSYSEVPPRVDYRLTDHGVALAALVRKLEQWLIETYPELTAP